MRTGAGWMSTFHVDPTQLNAYSDLIGQFADDVAHNFSLPVSAQPEDQLKSPVGQLLSAVGTLTALDVNWRTERSTRMMSRGVPISASLQMACSTGMWSSSGPARVPGRKDLQGGTVNSGSGSKRCPT
jgi:hypothetical protein